MHPDVLFSLLRLILRFLISKRIVTIARSRAIQPSLTCQEGWNLNLISLVNLSPNIYFLFRVRSVFNCTPLYTIMLCKMIHASIILLAPSGVLLIFTRQRKLVLKELTARKLEFLAVPRVLLKMLCPSFRAGSNGVKTHGHSL